MCEAGIADSAEKSKNTELLCQSCLKVEQCSGEDISNFHDRAEGTAETADLTFGSSACHKYFIYLKEKNILDNVTDCKAM